MITISVPKATDNDIQRGIAAAIAVFEAEGIEPELAAFGVSLRERWDIGGFQEEIDGAALAAADVWDRAGAAALEAACASWPVDRPRPRWPNLSLLTDPECQLADRLTALRKLREIATGKSTSFEKMANKVAMLVNAAARDIDDRFETRDLVADVTCAFTGLSLGSYRKVPVETKRSELLAAIDKLDAASEAA